MASSVLTRAGVQALICPVTSNLPDEIGPYRVPSRRLKVQFDAVRRVISSIEHTMLARRLKTRGILGLGDTIGRTLKVAASRIRTCAITSCQDGTTDRLGGALVLDQEILLLNSVGQLLRSDRPDSFCSGVRFMAGPVHGVAGRS